MKGISSFLIFALLFAACGKVEMNSWDRVNLPEGYSDSHILSIDVRDDGVLLGTFGRGALLKANRQAGWVVYDTSSGLSWDYIMGGDWKNGYIVLGTLGDGLNISTDGGRSWERYGYNYFGIEYLYTVGAKIAEKEKYIPTADGLVVFDSIGDWRSITEADGLGSQYIYDLKMRGDVIALGTLHGYSISYDGGRKWFDYSPDGRFAGNGAPACKVRAVEFRGERLYAGCDDGLYLSTDNGKSWRRIGQDHLSTPYIHDVTIDGDDNIWVATYAEIGSCDPDGVEWKIFNVANGLPMGGVNCLGITEDGSVLAGTHHGLYELGKGTPAPPTEGQIDDEFMVSESPLHQWMLRPIGPDDQNLKDQTYLYGATMGGNFRQHQGNEYNNPEGTPILAVDDGTIVYIDREIGHSVLKCDRKEGEFFVYAHYHHQNKILRGVGDRVNRGDVIGTVGKKGNVTNEHLHFEVSLSSADDSNKESNTRNPELWVAPLPGTGTIVGKLEESGGSLVGGARIYGLSKPVPTETPFSFAETYKDSVHSDESYGENFVIGDVPAGEYILTCEYRGKRSSVGTIVEPGQVTRVVMDLK